MDSNVKEKLLNDLKKTGYPLELKVGNVFAATGWGSIDYSRYYFDKEEQKGREIDISAYTNAYNEKVCVGLHIVCEVKKTTDKPWIVFSTRRN